MYLSRSTQRHIGQWLTGLATKCRDTALRKQAYRDLKNKPDWILDDVGLVRDDISRTVRRSDLPF